MEEEDKCEECGGLRGTNIYCWNCGLILKPWTYQPSTVKPSEVLDGSKKLKDGPQLKKKRISKRTRNKNGRFRKKRSDAGKPRKKKVN